MRLVGEHQQIMEMINDPEVDQQTVLDTLEGIEGEISIKADGYGYVLRGIAFERAALAGKREYLKKLLEMVDKQDKRLADTEESMKDRFMAAMIAIGMDEEGIKTEEFEFKIVSSGGQEKLETVDEKIPDSFKTVVQTFKPDNAKIREYVKEHPDCDWARLLPRKRSLKVKGV